MSASLTSVESLTKSWPKLYFPLAGVCCTLPVEARVGDCSYCEMCLSWWREDELTREETCTPVAPMQFWRAVLNAIEHIWLWLPDRCHLFRWAGTNGVFTQFGVSKAWIPWGHRFYLLKGHCLCTFNILSLA